jgi:hypothetical protein
MYREELLGLPLTVLAVGCQKVADSPKCLVEDHKLALEFIAQAMCLKRQEPVPPSEQNDHHDAVHTLRNQIIEFLSLFPELPKFY